MAENMFLQGSTLVTVVTELNQKFKNCNRLKHTITTPAQVFTFVCMHALEYLRFSSSLLS